MAEPYPDRGDQGHSDSICFAEMAGGVVVIRVMGRGSFANSVELKKLTDYLSGKHSNGTYRFVIDLSDCVTMDSTFMGVLASVGLRQKRDTPEKMIIVNANEQNQRLLKTLGLSHFINVRCEAHKPDVPEQEFQHAQLGDISKTDRIVHMIEAHKNLCEIDSENSVRFESVLKYLHESLDREKDKGNDY